MTDSIRQQIITAVDTRFKAITLPGSYNSVRQRIIDFIDLWLAGEGLGEGPIGDGPLGYD